ncbi:N-acetylneuraminate synthase [Ohtaekwangia kribbensis]|uniref:N-acetylneuraminate synthase n=1 Tax=Ohtaekwangia kribbensis TaxID=688913 RepID=A0ABW3KAJ5_9BACT
MSRVTIIAEAGVNHNGEIEKAKQLIDAAAKAGADYVKFQTFKADKLVSTEAKKAAYQAKNINDGDDSQYGMLKKLELSEEDHHTLKKYAQQAGIKFLSTGFDEDSLDFLDSIGIDFFKVPSGEITNYPYLQHIASKKKPVLVSTGMSSLGEIEQALDVLTGAGVLIDNIAVLHCNSQYPTPFEDVNLAAMLSIKDAFKVRVGYSDHTLGIEIPIAAVALGATVIEKHFTLDRNLPGPDHKASLEPNELAHMVSSIRNVELALQGDGRKRASASEAPNKNLVRKSIHLATDKKEGDVLSKSDLIMKRPGDGISPMLIDLVIGKKVSKNLAAGEKLTWQHFH